MSRTSRSSDARTPFLRQQLALWFLCSLFLACHGQSAPRLPEGPPSAKSLVLFGPADLKALRPEGGTILVALWATWCEPCLREFAVLDAFAKKRPNVMVVGLATEDTASPVSAGRIDAVFRRLRPTYAQARIRPGGEHELLSGLGLEWDGILPKTFVIRPDGGVKLVEAYDTPTLEAEFRRLESP